MRRILIVGIGILAVGCGGPAPRGAQSGGAASTSAVEVSGRASERGTRGPVLVFAYNDLAAGEDPAVREPLSVGTVTQDGGFDLSLPPSATLTLVFLADGSNDGAIDEGDPIALFSSPELTDLEAGDRVQITDMHIDFKARRADGTIEVVRAAGEPVRTPTPAP